ncbi:hypothetical protein PQE75_gp012 [Bacillus phage vB_BcoS-136]|uniref:Uncharacterized protein n=1 Tax=Bacillus phage vB_BcoS-136 TaxID=2419619 RepID=A0A3G3BVA3_9CAUD|nr:hypothetical protein PQE75_gp012 [Bacillus phage vB_BcoS-136]AYP68144.1 hypothetical protein vBBcoS136_00012 [Bacillus phage vB_BcoS-136]
MAKKKKKKKRTIGEMCGSRATWNINPITRVKEDKKGKNDRKEVKRKIKRGDFDE